MPSTPFSLRHPSGLQVPGDLHLPSGPGPFPVTVLCHGFKGFRRWGFFPFLADALAAEGIAAVRFDFSLNGIGDDDTHTRPDDFARNTITQELADLGLVLEALRAGSLEARLDPSRLALLGHSRGNGIALVRALEDPGVRAVIGWAGVDRFGGLLGVDPAEWKRAGFVEVLNTRTKQVLRLNYSAHEDYEAHRARYDFLPRLMDLKRPALFVHCRGDAVVSVDASRRVAVASGGGLLEIQGGDHAFGAVHPFAGTTSMLSEAVGGTVAFLTHALAGGTPRRAPLSSSR